MKNLILFVVLLAIQQSSFAQRLKSEKVPSVVKTAFAEKFPNVEFEGWEVEDGAFEAEFEISEEQEMSAVFAPDGTLLYTETEIGISELPIAILSKYSNKKIKEACKIEYVDGSLLYEVEIRGKGELRLDSEGNVVQ